MSESPFRDDRPSLISTIEDLRRQNEILGAEVNRLRSELEHLRDLTPENQQAFLRRQQEDLEELRAQVAELESLRDELRLVKRENQRLTRGL
jgi:chromosome segregation ATPase